MQAGEDGRVPHIAPLDGIRAVAVLAVLLFHSWPTALRGGFTGVDVFFVLSGFLIATGILTDLSAGRFSMAEFYVRRVQRLIPNASATVLAVLLLWSIFLPPSSARQAGEHGLWTMLSLSNFYAWRDLGSYWGNAAIWAPLTHTWSLGVEEQFYLLFPGTLLLLTRFQPGRILAWLAAGAVLDFAVCLYATYTHPAAAFYLLPFRAWELLLGAALAAWRTPARGPADRACASTRPRVGRAAGWFGLLGIALGFVVSREDRSFPGIASLFPTVGTALLIASVTNPGTALGRYLSTRPMVGLGRASYSVYLWHWPIIILARSLAGLYGMGDFAAAALGAPAGLALGWSAYALLERPLRRRGPGRPWRLAAIAAGFAAAVACCLVAGSRRLVADPARRFDVVEFYFGHYDAGRNAGLAQAAASVPYYDVHFPPLPSHRDDAWRTGGILHLYGGGAPRVVVLGSSHALMYSKLVDDICRDRRLSVAFLGVGGGTPAFFESIANENLETQAQAREFDDARRRWLRLWRPDSVFVIDRWDIRFERAEKFEDDLHSFLGEVCPVANRVIFVAQVPVLSWGDINPREYVCWHLSRTGRLPRFPPDSNESLRAQAVASATKEMAEFPGLRVLRADRAFFHADGSVRYSEGRKFFYVDNNHLSAAGAEEVRALFEDAIADVGPGALHR